MLSAHENHHLEVLNPVNSVGSALEPLNSSRVTKSMKETGGEQLNLYLWRTDQVRSNHKNNNANSTLVSWTHP